MKIPVSKYHGCGNDFLLIPEEIVAGWSEEERKELIVTLCDRHTGIGADGMIFPTREPFEMIYYNQDGSRADTCGNGIRCLACWLVDHQYTDQSILQIQTLAGERTIEILSRHPFICRVCMGKPEFDSEKNGIQGSLSLWNTPVLTEAGEYVLNSFYMNTIHTVVFVQEDPFDPRWAVPGSAICHHPLFTKQTNVNFVQVLDSSHIKAATWERGCGMTLACGTGMCASVVAACRQKKTGNQVHVQMKKGTLDIEIQDDGTVFMSGPAARILEGEADYEKTGRHLAAAVQD